MIAIPLLAQAFFRMLHERYLDESPDRMTDTLVGLWTLIIARYLNQYDTIFEENRERTDRRACWSSTSHSEDQLERSTDRRDRERTLMQKKQQFLFLAPSRCRPTWNKINEYQKQFIVDVQVLHFARFF